MTSTSMLLVIWAMMEEPAALGCTAAMSPERPIPCPNLINYNKKKMLILDSHGSLIPRPVPSFSACNIEKLEYPLPNYRKQSLLFSTKVITLYTAKMTAKQLEASIYWVKFKLILVEHKLIILTLEQFSGKDHHFRYIRIHYEKYQECIIY